MSENSIMSFLSIQKQKNMEVINNCNNYTNQFGLALKPSDINDLMERQKENLHYTGRIEFGETIIPKIIFEFCDSQYISQDNYIQTLDELQEMFFFFKNETDDELSDDELIHGMKQYFDDVCQGSLDYLRSTYLEYLMKEENYGIDMFGDSDKEDDQE